MLSGSNRGKIVQAGALAAVLVGSAGAVRADDRRFGYVDEARVAPLNNFEFEQWFTWEHTNGSGDGSVDGFFFKEELEYGVAENTQLGFEIPAWHFTTGPSGENQGPRVDQFAADIKHIFLDPVSDPIGIAAKGEIGLGESIFSLEGELILQKTIDKWEFAYNMRLEAEWATDEDGNKYSEDDGEFVNTLGASYEATTKFFVGAELLYEIPLPEWHTGATQVLWLGPNASYHETNWAITATILPRLTSSDEEPNFQFRAIFEIDF